MNRMLLYYQRIMQNQYTLIEDIKETQKTINDQHKALISQTSEQNQLQQRLKRDQQALQQDKSRQSELVNLLDQDISNKQLKLDHFAKDKERLGNLITTLSKQQSAFTNTSFNKLKHRLPSPVRVNKNAIRQMNQGLTFFAQEGATVTAVHAGKVVFSDWLRGYGLLLIIDHGDGFMSLYAHNLTLLKHTGDLVSPSEHIATVGHSGGLKQNGLYFEIRHRGKAIPPSDWLA